MKNNDDIFNEIADQFKDDNLELPERLSKENIKELISSRNITQEKKAIKLYPKIISIAAVFIFLVVVGLVASNLFSEQGTVVPVSPSTVASTTAQAPTQITEATQQQTQPGTESQEDFEIITTTNNVTDETTYPIIKNDLKTISLSKADSDESLKNYFKDAFTSLKTDTSSNDYKDQAPTFSSSADSTTQAETTISGNSPASGMIGQNNTGNSDTGFGETNIQVDGVDEGDIIKNDGRYLYIVTYNHFITIVDTTIMERLWYGEIEGGENETYSINDIYVKQNNLIAICTKSTIIEQTNDTSSDETETTAFHDIMSEISSNNDEIVTVTYDISNKSQPKETRRVSQDGFPVSSRMVGNYLYTVSQYDVYCDEDDLDEKYMPSVNGTMVGCDNVYIRKTDDYSTCYILLTAYDITNPNSEIGKVSVLGDGYDVYCTTDSLYVSSDRYYFDEETDDSFDTTDIYSFSINENNISYSSCTSVNGTTIGQFSFDEYDGFLRIATTSYDYETSNDSSNIYILNKNLELIGQLEDFAENETIQAARFMNNICYLVTYENTDPLFTVDLSDPSNPTILGQLKIPGFSEYLHPVADNYVIGIGYDGDSQGADYSTLKISLFDVSDLKNPKLLDSYTFKKTNNYFSSDVSNDPKAFVFNAETNTFGIPISQKEYTLTGDFFSGSYFYQTFSVKDGKLISEGKYEHSNADYLELFRGTYIGNTVFTIDADFVIAHSTQTGEVIGRVDISQDYDYTYPMFGYIQ